MAGPTFSQVSVGTSATLVASWTRGEHPFKVHIENQAPPGSSLFELYVGGPSVTGASNGYRIYSGNTLVLDVPPADRGSAGASESVYAVATSASGGVFVAIGPS